MQISMNDVITEQEVIALYTANHWSSAEKPKELMAALRNSHSLVTARADGKLIGIGNAISDGHLVVYFPHMLVDPMAQGQGVGRKMMAAMLEKYAGFTSKSDSDGKAIAFYESLVSCVPGKQSPCGSMRAMSIEW